MPTTAAERRVHELRQELKERARSEINMMAVEGEIREAVEAIGRELVREVLMRADRPEPELLIDGVPYGNRRVTPGTYYSTFGAVEIPRATYQSAERGPVAVPVDLQLGIFEGHYTPKLAHVMALATASMPGEESSALLEAIGMSRVSVSTLHRIPQAMMARYEERRAEIEPLVRAQHRVPEAAVSVQCSIDGVMVPQDGENTGRRGRKADDPEPPRHEQRYGPMANGPSANDGLGGRPWHEASVATLAFVDKDGEVLETIYVGRMPEPLKATTEALLGEELLNAIAQRPDLNITFGSDGAPQHWDILARIEARLPTTATGRRWWVADFFHVAGYLREAAAAVWGQDSKQAKLEVRHWCDLLKIFDDGPLRVLKALRHQRKKVAGRKRDTVDKAIDYVFRQRHAGRMNYAELLREHQLIGTGVVEAAAKTIVSVRMKRAGARYSQHGGQTIITLRAASRSGRLVRMLDLLGDTYKRKVDVLHAA